MTNCCTWMWYGPIYLHHVIFDTTDSAYYRCWTYLHTPVLPRHEPYWTKFQCHQGRASKTQRWSHPTWSSAMVDSSCNLLSYRVRCCRVDRKLLLLLVEGRGTCCVSTKFRLYNLFLLCKAWVRVYKKSPSEEVGAQREYVSEDEKEKLQ